MSIGGMTGLYVKIIHFFVRFPSLVIIGMGIIAMIIVMMFRASMGGESPKPVEFFTNDAGNQIYVIARARGNGTPDQDLALAKDIEKRISGIEGIRSVYTVAGAGAVGASEGGNPNGPSVPDDAVVRVFTELLPFQDRRSSQEIIDDLRLAVNDIAGVYTEIQSISCLLYTSPSPRDRG